MFEGFRRYSKDIEIRVFSSSLYYAIFFLYRNTTLRKSKGKNSAAALRSESCCKFGVVLYTVFFFNYFLIYDSMCISFFFKKERGVNDGLEFLNLISLCHAELLIS